MRWRRNEQGAVAIVLALVVCFVLIPISALAVDLGEQRVARRDMQALADVVALDMSRQLTGGKLSSYSTPSLQALANASRDRNATTVGHASDGKKADVSFELGTIDRSKYGESSYFTKMTDPNGVPTAVRVTANTEVGFGLANALPGGGIGSGGASRSAIATTGGSACYKAGSFALGLATNKSILAPILGDAAATRVLSYGGLTTANVSLLGLAAQLGVGTPDQLLTAPSITVGNVLDAYAALLTKEGGTANLQLATQLGQVKTDLGPLVSKNVDFGKVLALGQGNASALDAEVNVLDIITSGLIVANGVNGVAVPGLNLNLGALGALTAKLYITQAPKIGCNGGDSTSAQGYVELSGNISLAGLATLKNVSLKISLANATARQNKVIACSTTTLSLDVVNQTLADVRLTADVYALLGLLKLATIDTGVPPSAPDHTYPLPLPDSYTTPVTTDSGSLGLDLTNADVKLLGVLNVGSLISALAPLVNGVGTLLTGTLLPALGITTDGADLWAVPTVSCSAPALVG